MLALPGVPGATPAGKALALRREGPGASSEELQGALVHSGMRDLLPTFRGAHAVQNQGLSGHSEARVFAYSLCLPIVEPWQTGSSVQQGHEI